MPPATRLTIRAPGIFTSIGYGTPRPRPCGMFFKPSLPFARSLEKKLCHDLEAVDERDDRPPDKNPWMLQTPVQVLPSRLASGLLTGEVKVCLALSPPECLVRAECGKKLVCGSQA